MVPNAEVALEKPHKVSLSDALRSIADILSIAEEGGNEDEAINSCLELAFGQLANSVDRRLGLFRALTGGKLTVDETATGVAGAVRSQIENLQRQYKAIKKLAERIKLDTLFQIEQAGLDEIHGKSGRFYLQNSPMALEHSIPLRSITRSNVISHDDIILNQVPAEYLVMEQITVLNTEAIKSDLSKGREVPWAKLSQSKHLRAKHQLKL